MIKIVSDTLSCITEETAKEKRIPLIPQVIVFGEETFMEREDMNVADFIKKLKTSNIHPSTAAPPPPRYKEVFEKYLAEGHSILCLGPSEKLSGTLRSGQVAAKDLPDADITFLDTKVLGSPYGTMVLEAAELAEQGKSMEEIVAHVEDMMSKLRMYFLVDTLEYLAKGGRIGNASALLGGLLQIKPILTINDGLVDTLEKTRTQKRARARLIELVTEEIAPNGKGRITIMHADALEDAKQLAADLAPIAGVDKIPIYDVPPAITTHGGPGVLGVGFFTT